MILAWSLIKIAWKDLNMDDASTIAQSQVKHDKDWTHTKQHPMAMKISTLIAAATKLHPNSSFKSSKTNKILNTQTLTRDMSINEFKDIFQYSLF